MGAYTKSIWAALMAGLTAAVTVLSGDPSTSKWVTVAISVASVLGVFVAPNLPKAAADDLNTLLAALHPTTEGQPLVKPNVLTGESGTAYLGGSHG